MSEAGRVSIAVEVTGLPKAESDLQKFDSAGAKASASFGRSMAALEKQMAAIDAIVTKASGGVISAIDRQTVSMTKGFASVDAAMRRMQTGTAAAAASVSADAGKAGASLSQLDAIADRVAAGVTAALAGIAPAAASAATGTQQAMTAMAGFDAAAQTIVAASARMEAALQEATGATRALSDSFAKAPKSDPFKPQSDGAENLRAKFNPLFAIGETYRTQVASIRQANADGAIGFHEMEMAIQRAGAVADAQQRQYVKMDAALGATGDAARLTSNQMLNLSRQGNDAITMFAMGASPMQIFASQAGQIYGALEEGPRGLRGSLEAIKGTVMGFAAGLGPAGIALGALGAAAVTFGIATRRNVEPIEDVIKAQEGSVRQLRDAYGLAGDAAEDYGRRALISLQRDAIDASSTALSRARNEIQERFTSQYAGSFNRLNEMRFAGAPELRAAFESLYRSIEAGTPRFIEFREELASIPDTDLPYFIKEAIQANREWAGTFVPLQQQIEGTESALDGTAAAAQRYKDAMGDLVALTPDLRTNAEQINDAFNAARAGPAPGDEMVAMFQRQKAMAADTAGALDIYTQARAELAAVGLGDDARAIAQINAEYDALEDQYLGNADALAALVDARKAAIQAVGAESAIAEKARRDNYELDLRAVDARTAAEKASIESERVRIDLMAQGYSATEAAARATEAYTLAIAQSSAEWTKAAESRQFAREDALANAQAQIDSFGMSAGAAQAYGQAIQQLTAYRRAAAEAGMPIDPAEEQAIRDAASAAGAYTDALARMNMERDQAAQIELLRGEARLVGLSENARSIAMAGLQAEADLRRQNLSTTDEQGAAYIRNAQAAAGMRVEIDRQTAAYEKQDLFVRNVLSEAVDGLFDIGKAESWGDAVAGIFENIGRLFQEAAKQNLMQALFGQNYTTGQLAPGQRSIAQPGFPAGFGSVPVAANQNVPAGGALNIGAVQALNTNLQRSSRSALDVARQFDGLNERADSAVLDSFMQASGNWNNLSAADTAWCAAFANAAIAQAGGRGTGSNLASSFMGWGQGTNAPQVGDIVVLKPQSAGASGHVGFVAGFGDGKVQVFGGNQSNAANTRSFGLDQVRGYRTGVGVGGAGIGGSFAMPQMAAPVYAPQMSGAAQQAMAQGWSGFGPVPGQVGSSTLGWFGQGGRISNFMQSPVGQMGMMGLGAFGSGYSSGSTGSGALSGGLTGFMTGGPIGGIVGLVGGALGGLFGGRAKRRQEHQQKAQAWEQMSPQWEEYQRMLRADAGPASGLRAAYGAIDQQMVDFVRVGSAAWKNGSNNSSALFDQVSQSRVGYQQRTNQAFAGGFDASVRSLNAGQGMESPFIQARDGIVEVGKSLLTFVDDARIVFGDGSEQVQKATEASVAQLRAMVSGSNELTEVGTALEVLAGAGNALGNQLMQLGVSFEDATREVGEAAHLMITRIRGDFVQGIEDQIAALDGKSYLADVRETIAGIDLMLKDAAALNVDRSLVDNLFAKQAQAIVNGAELTGEAFADLVTQFPRLAGVVTEFSAAAEEAAKRTADQIAALRLSYDDRVFEVGVDTSTEAGALARFDRYAAREREEEIKAGGDAILDLERALAAERGQILKQFADRAAEETKRAMESAQSFLDGFARNIGSYLDGLRAGPDSPLTGQARVDEARKQFEEQLGLARGGDRDALGSITSYADRLLEADRAYNTSSPAAQATFDEVTRALEGLPKQLKAEDIVSAEIAKAAKDLQETIRQTALDLAARISTDFAKFDANFDGFLTIDELRPHFAGTELELRRIFSEIDLNGDGQISRLEGLLASDGLTRSTLQSAFLLGPNATAGALAPHFARLDTSLDGLLSFDEMRIALGGIATDDQIRQMMTALDTNGDGQLSYLELINANGRVQVGQTQTQATTLAAIERLTVQQLATANWHTQWFDTLAKHITHGTNINQSSQHQGHLLLDRIRANLAEGNGRNGLRQFAMGGISNVPAIFGEAGSEAAVPLPDGRSIPVTLSTPRMPVMPQMMNDNGSVAELRQLRTEIREDLRALKMITAQGAMEVRGAVKEGTAIQREQVAEVKLARSA